MAGQRLRSCLKTIAFRVTVPWGLGSCLWCALWVCLMLPILVGIKVTTPGAGRAVGALAFCVDGVPVMASVEDGS